MTLILDAGSSSRYFGSPGPCVKAASYRSRFRAEGLPGTGPRAARAPDHLILTNLRSSFRMPTQWLGKLRLWPDEKYAEQHSRKLGWSRDLPRPGTLLQTLKPSPPVPKSPVKQRCLNYLSLIPRGFFWFYCSSPALLLEEDDLMSQLAFCYCDKTLTKTCVGGLLSIYASPLQAIIEEDQVTNSR